MARRKNETIPRIQRLEITFEKSDSNFNSNNEIHFEEQCKVLLYNEETKELDIDFRGFGIRLSAVIAVKPIKSDYVFIQYIGEIGKADFRCWYV